MQKHLLYINLFAITSALALGACADEVENAVTPDMLEVGEKTPIELSVGGVDAPAQSSSTRAVITNGEGKTLNPFDVNTKIFMVMKSEYGTADFDDPDNPSVAKYTVARGDVLVSENDNTNNRSVVKFDAKNQRFWDDAHARSSQLDIWAYAQKGQSWTVCTFEVPNAGGRGIDSYKDKSYNTANTPSPIWTKGTAGEIYPAIRTWKASHHIDDGGVDYRQDATSVMCQDLLFSNNLTNNPVHNPSTGAPDNRLKFDFPNRKFPRAGEANMIFYHAMSKITIHIKKGDGFTNTDPFAFSTGNVKLKGFNTEGLFNIKTGQFEYIWEHYDIPEIYKWNTAAAGDAYTLEALVIPNVDGNVDGLTDSYSILVEGKKSLTDDVMMEFVIDNNKYQITSDQLCDALFNHDASGNKTTPVSNATPKAGTHNIPLEAGKNYVFTFTVGKTKIKNITAQVADWENVDAENINPSNARIKLQLEERGEAQTSNVAFYRAADNISDSDPINDEHTVYNWKTGYSNMNATYSSTHWTTNLFWQSNKEFFHFRAVMPAATGVTTEAENGDYFKLSSSSCADAANYNTIAWGAPMLDDGDNNTNGSFKWHYGPTAKGFDAKDDGTVATGLPTSTQHQIYKAIGPTENPVKLVLFHMMSGVHFSIKTDDTKDSKVQLYDNTAAVGKQRTKVELVGYYKDGKVLLGTGLVNVDETISSVETPYSIDFASATVATAYANQEYFFSAVPQDLSAVKLYITTPDNNQYIVDLGNVAVAKVDGSDKITSNNIANPYDKITEGPNVGKYQIDRWYPGFKYNYSFTLAKTGITNLEATIVEWEEVTAEDETVTIK